MASSAYYMPSLAYGTPSTTISYKEFDDVQQAVVAAILPKMGSVRNAARKVVFGLITWKQLKIYHAHNTSSVISGAKVSPANSSTSI
jgi:hypothetical protein